MSLTEAPPSTRNVVMGQRGVGVHGLNQIRHLEGDGVQHRPGNVGLGGATGQPHDGATGVHVPVGGAQAGEGGHHVDASGVRHALRQPVALRGGGDEPQFIPQPLDGAAGVEHAALQGIGSLAPQGPSHGGYQSRLGGHRLTAHIHQREAAGAVGVLRLARREAGLAGTGPPAGPRRCRRWGCPPDPPVRECPGPHGRRMAVGQRLRQSREAGMPSARQSASSHWRVWMLNSMVREALE